MHHSSLSVKLEFQKLQQPAPVDRDNQHDQHRQLHHPGFMHHQGCHQQHRHYYKQRLYETMHRSEHRCIRLDLTTLLSQLVQAEYHTINLKGSQLDIQDHNTVSSSKAVGSFHNQ